MDSPERILSLLGLALRGGNLAVGEEPVEAVARARDARLLLLAADAAAGTCRRAAHFAEAGQCLLLHLPFTKAELGRAVGRTAAAIVAVTDVGLASAAAHRLAELDPARYSEAAARLDLKAKRAAERRAEQLAHEKNLRTGRRKPKKAPPPALEPSPKSAPGGRGGPRPDRPPAPKAPPERSGGRKSRPSKENRPKPRAKPDPYAHSRPVKKGKGSPRRTGAAPKKAT